MSCTVIQALRCGRDRWLAGALMSVVPWLASGAPASEPAAAHFPVEAPDGLHPGQAGPGFSRVILTDGPVSRVLRGDYEAPGELVVAYEREWEASVAQLIRAARGQARVKLLTRGTDRDRPFLAQASKWSGVQVMASHLDTPWVRDFGPFEANDKAFGRVWLDFDYSWERPGDDALPSWLSNFSHRPVEHSDFVVDGGGVVSNGRGLCAMTATSLERSGFAPQAPGELSSLFAELGCPVTAILPEIPAEPTGHADVVAQFLAPDVVAVASVDPEQHALVASRLDQAVDALVAAAELASVALDVVRVPIQIQDGVYYSYVNVTRLTTRLLVPGFVSVEPTSEAEAYQILQAVLPKLELVRIEADGMARRGGGVHCVTLGLGQSQVSRGS